MWPTTDSYLCYLRTGPSPCFCVLGTDLPESCNAIHLYPRKSRSDSTGLCRMFDPSFPLTGRATEFHRSVGCSTPRSFWTNHALIVFVEVGVLRVLPRRAVLSFMVALTTTIAVIPYCRTERNHSWCRVSFLSPEGSSSAFFPLLQSVRL